MIILLSTPFNYYNHFLATKYREYKQNSRENEFEKKKLRNNYAIFLLSFASGKVHQIAEAAFM